MTATFGNAQLSPNSFELRERGAEAPVSSENEKTLTNNTNSLKINGLNDGVNPSSSYTKRVIDILGATALLLLFAPLMAVIFFVVRQDGAPAIFRQQRVGKNGKLFSCYKFRSMIPDAEKVLLQLLEKNEEYRLAWEADQKLREDPRITKIGGFLRRKSLDELPQLFNVIKGDMSLVGPRPITPDEICRYGDEIKYYLKTRPGLTGAWQVSGRNDVSYKERVAIDVEYTTSWTFIRDIIILFKTVRVVLDGRGAV